jgi:hypothetical protein
LLLAPQRAFICAERLEDGKLAILEGGWQPKASQGAENFLQSGDGGNIEWAKECAQSWRVENWALV